MELREMMPGRLLHRIAIALCSRAFCQRVVEPLLADLQHEWSQATGLHRLEALASGYAAFWRAFGSHALRAWVHEIVCMSWRDAFPFPGVLGVFTVSLSLSHAWVTTGSILNARFDQIDMRNLWLMLPVFVIHRWLPVDSGIRALAVHAVAFGAFAVLLEKMVALRPFMRGGTAFLVYLVVMVVVQAKKSVVEAPDRHGRLLVSFDFHDHFHRLTADRAVLDILLRRPAARIDIELERLAAVRTVDGNFHNPNP